MGAAGHTTETLLLTVGTEEGVLMRVEVDDRTGKLEWLVVLDSLVHDQCVYSK